jgi:hypothetical protein
MVEFELAKRISENGYPAKVYYPYGDIHTGIYDNYATLEDVNDDTIAIYIHVVHGNPLRAKRIVRWLVYGVDSGHYNQYQDGEIIYYHIPFCKNNITTQRLFSCRLSPEVKNRHEPRSHTLCYTIKKGMVYNKNHIRLQTGKFPHDILVPHSTNRLSFLKNPNVLCFDGNYSTLEEQINLFNKTKYFYCYDPCSFLIIMALLCGCIVIQDPIDGYTEEEWMYAIGIHTKLKGLAYGIENLKYAENTIGDAYDNCMEFINQRDSSIKKFLHDMEHKTYNTDKCYKYSESPYAIMIK